MFMGRESFVDAKVGDPAGSIERVTAPADVFGQTEDALRWGVVQTVGGRELHAHSGIGEQGFAVYLPRYVAMMPVNGRRPDRKRPVMRPLFPGYLFVGWRPRQDDWSVLFHTKGVMRLLMRDGVPQRLPRAFLFELAGHENEIAKDYKWLRQQLPLKVGDKVKAIEGPFRGIVGELTKLDDAGRITILLDILGGKTPISGLDVTEVEKV